MAYGITEQGFIRKTREIIVSELQESYREKFGNLIDLSVYSQDGIRLNMTADVLDENWKLAESVYNAVFLTTATGVNLDRVCGQGGLLRQPAKRAIVDLEFTGEDLAEIPLGTICQTASGIQFITIEDGVISGTTTVVKASAVEAGASGNVASLSVNEIATPIVGIDSVENPDPASLGRAIETDAEFRLRYKERGVAGGSSAVSIQTILNNVESIITAIVYENATAFTDVDGRPPYSMEAVIEGGNNNDIANALLNNWPGGTESYGSLTATIIDNKGITRNFKYNNPTDITIYVRVEITRDLTKWITGSEAIVKKNCVKLVGGIDNAISYPGQGIGADVYSWLLIAAQQGLSDFSTEKIAGIDSIKIFVGLSANPLSGDTIVIAGRERAKLLTANINVVLS